MKTLPNFPYAFVAAVLVAWISGVPLFAESQPARPAASQSSTADETRPDQEQVGERAGEQAGEMKGESAEETKDRTPAADAILIEARDQLKGFRSIKAGIVQTVAIGDRKFKATGSYLQGTDLKLRLNYEVEVGASQGSLLEVCDGQVLWTRHTVNDEPRITRRDVRQILAAAVSGTNRAEHLLVAELGLGGLPALLSSLQQRMQFDQVREEQIDGEPFAIIEGTWNQEFLQGWKEANPQSPQRLPDHIPDSVRVYFDRQNLLPRRIMYLKDARSGEYSRPMVTLDFVDLVLNAPVNDDEFYFVPPDGVPQEDITHLYLQRFQTAPSGEQTPDAPTP